MTSGQKLAFSSLVSIALFGCFAFFTKTGFISQIETRFYAQAKVQQKIQQIDTLSEGIENYIQNVLKRIETADDAYLKSVAVSSYLMQDPAESDTVERRNLTEQLFYDYPALNGIRFIDKNGRNIHFSTYERTDVSKHVGIKKQYKNYTDLVADGGEIDVKQIFSENHQPERKIYFDEPHNRFLIILPVNWMDNVYAGCFVFYFDLKGLETHLINENVLAFTDNLELISDSSFNGGFVVGVPKEDGDAFSAPVLDYWKKRTSVMEKTGFSQPEKILSLKDGRFWMILNQSRVSAITVSGVYTSDLFELSMELIYLIYTALFISIFLVVFLLFSLKRDSMQVLQKRIKKLQYGIIKEYLKNQEKVEWSEVAAQLKIRNSEISQEIRNSLGKKNKYNSEEIDAVLDKSWNDIINVVTHYSGGAAAVQNAVSKTNSVENEPKSTENSVTIEQIRQVMKELLQTTAVNVANVQAVEVKAKQKITETSSKIVPEAEEELQEIEDVEEIEEVEELSEDIDSVEEVEELTDEAEELEEIGEVEAADEADEAEELEEIEEIEELSDSADSVEEIEEVEELDESVEETEEVEALEEVEELTDEAEQVEEIGEIETVEEPDELQEIEEPADDVEVLEDVEELSESVESVETVDEIEEIEEIDEIEEIEEIADVADDLEELIDIAEEFEISDDFVPPAPPLPDLDSILEDPSDVYINVNGNFATVDNVLLEELCLSDGVVFPEPYKPDAFKLMNYPELKQEDVELEELQEETELMQESSTSMFKNQFSMIQFGYNAGAIQDLQGFDALNTSSFKQNTIVENEGVFSISDNLEYSGVKQNLAFKNLVDSVLR